MAGVPASADAVEQVDRARAIMQTVWACAPEDVLLLAGKGHETYQDSGGEKLPFDDREWARLALLLPQVATVSTDTRRIGAGELFVALAGEKFDAHDYLDQAEARGACAAVVAHPVAGVKLPQLVLGDTRVALMRIGAAWRARYSLPVVAVTGSNGKTTTKEMISSVLAAWKGETNRLATAGNLNNDIGVPLTLLRLRATHRAAVFELGMNHPGEIAQLAAIAAPSVALVTNAQREHQEFMHTVEAVAHENGAAIAACRTTAWPSIRATSPIPHLGCAGGLAPHAALRPAAGPGRLRRADSGGSVLHPLQGSDAGGHGRPGVASGRPA